jgi:hypothetical protein
VVAPFPGEKGLGAGVVVLLEEAAHEGHIEADAE